MKIINYILTISIFLTTGICSLLYGQDYSELYLFATDGKIITEEVKIQDSSDWPDFVFSTSYEMQSLEELEQFILTNGHLPEIPSEKSVIENGGFELGKLNKILLQKVEELTLHLISERKERIKLENQLSKILYDLNQLNNKE